MESSQEKEQKEIKNADLRETDMDELAEQFKTEYKKERGNSNLLYQVPYLSELAHRYQEKDDWPSLLRAHSLYNSCVVRDIENREQWLERAYQVQVDYWKTDLQSFSQHLQVTQTLKQELEEIRAIRRRQIERIAGVFYSLDCEPDKLSCSRNQEIYAQMLDETPYLSNCVNQDMIGFTKSVVEKSIAICGPPAFGYCVVALGSLARGETTPYSDLEFLFLVESKTDEAIRCFERLAVTMYFLIGNLGETKLKYMAIPELMSYNESTHNLKHWFDEPVMSGFKIDGLGSWSGNIPTGGTDEQKNHLMCTVQELADRYKAVLDKPDPDKSLRGDLTAMLASTVYISGDQSLHDEFRSLLAVYEPNQKRQMATIEMLKRDAKRFKFTPHAKLTHTRHLKFDIHRYPSLLTFNLKIFYNIPSSDPWETIHVLEEKAAITKQAAENLKFSLCCAQIIRLSGYFYHNSQDEAISVLSCNKGENSYKGAWYLRPEILVHMFVNLMPLHKTVTESLSALQSFNEFGVIPTITMSMSDIDIYIAAALTRYYCNDYLRVLDLLRAAYPESLESADTHIQQMCMDSAVECNQYTEVERLLNQRIQSQSYDEYDFYLLGRIYEDQCYFPYALDCYETRMAILVSLHDFTDHSDVAQVYFNIGVILENLSKHDEAFQWYTACLDMRLRIFGDSYNPQIANVLCNLGTVLQKQSNFSLALVKYMECLDMRLRIYGDRDHEDIARVLCNISAMLDNLCKHNQALEWYTQSIDMMRRIYENKDHLQIAAALCNIGVILRKQSKFKAALERYTECLDMRLRIYGNIDHVQIADVLCNIGVILHKQNKHNEALDRYDQCFDMWLRIYKDRDHVEIADVLGNIGSVLESQSKFADALKRYNECLDIRGRIYGNTDNVQIADVLCDIGVVLDNLSRFDEALQRYTKCLEMRSRIYGTKNHADIADVLCNIGVVLSKQSKFDAALERFAECLEIRLRVHGKKDHLDIADVLSKMGVVLHNQRRYNGAMEHYSKCLAMRLRIYGNRDHVDIADVLCNMGASLTNQGDFEKALQSYSKCLGMWRRIHGDQDDVRVATVLCNTGVALCAQGRFDEALEQYEKCLDMRLRIYRDIDHVDIALVYCNIGALLQNQQKYNDALEQYKQSLVMFIRIFGDVDYPYINYSRQNIQLLENVLQN